MSMTGTPTPQINLRICVREKNTHGKISNIRVLPDTGASVDCISVAYAKRYNLPIVPDKDNDLELLAAKGNSVKVLGTTMFEIQAPGGGWITTTAMVCPRLSHDMMLSWVSQKRLYMLHHDWPFTIIKRNTALTASTTETPSIPRRLR